MMPDSDGTKRRAAFGRGLLLGLLLVPGLAAAQQPGGHKVFISVDMEGLAGVVTSSDVDRNGPDYAHFRMVMAGETNAAIEGAFRAGATEVVVRDSHGSKQNLLPGDVDPRARLLRGVSRGPRNMMEGIDASFDAIVFIGYHAKAGTPNAILEHTSNGNVVDFAINGVSLPEGGYNALVGGLVGVPVVFVSGDRAVVDQLRGLLGPIHAVAVKEEIGDAALSLSPKQAQEQIRAGVEKAIRERASMKPYVMRAPFEMVLKVKEERGTFAGARRVRDKEFAFSSSDLLEILSAFNALK